MSDEPEFSVTLHHLAPDVKRADAALPDLELPGLGNKKLRELIRALGTLAQTNLGTASPELRVVAAQGKFVVQVAQGRLRLNSWAIKVGGADLTPEQIFSLISGAEATAEAAGIELADTPRKPRGVMLAVLGAIILASNALTAWMLMRPPPPSPLVPDFVPLAAEPAQRLIADIAGSYQTGATENVRGLKIGKDGHVHWLRLRPDGATAEDSEVVVQPVQASGKSALLADGRALIQVVDTASLVFYGETYRRKSP